MLKRVKKDLRVDIDYRQFVKKDKFTEELTPNAILEKAVGFNFDLLNNNSFSYSRSPTKLSKNNSMNKEDADESIFKRH